MNELIKSTELRVLVASWIFLVIDLRLINLLKMLITLACSKLTDKNVTIHES